MTYEAFNKQERKALDSFMRKHIVADFAEPVYPSYSRTYVCSCGFRTNSTYYIFLHSKEPHEDKGTKNRTKT